MNNFSVSLSRQPASEQWGERAILSFTTTGACIHLPDDSENCRLIQQAARKLDILGLSSMAFAGDWTAQQQWCFAMGFTRAKSPAVFEWTAAHRDTLSTKFAAVMFARGLVNETPEVLSPESLALQAATWLSSLAPQKVTYQLTKGEALEAAGWTGIYNVGRGSTRPPVMLELDFNPSGDTNMPVSVVLVGKGITFDSGGYSMKSSEGMLDMKCDMAGAATVTASLGLAMMQGLSKRVVLILCCAENLVSGHAYKLGDILRYKNGVSVEIVNTDAEGRLVLADGLIRASELKPDVIIDAATLTGAAQVAVGQDYHALFSMDDALANALMQSANTESEGLWRLPLAPWHRERCPSAFADTANSRAQKGGGTGGASNAAGFLSRFVNESGAGWAHLDLAAAYFGSATSEMPVGASGIGVKTLAHYLMQ